MVLFCFALFSSGHGVPLQADIAVGDMMKKDQERYPARREELLDMLGVDPEWRMHQVRFLSDESCHEIRLMENKFLLVCISS